MTGVGPGVDWTDKVQRLVRKSKYMNLKRQLKYYLNKKGMTPSELSRRSKVSKQVLSIWLNGGEPRKVTQVRAVAETLDTTVDNLVFGDGEPSVDQAKDLASLFGDEWIGGMFEIRIRRVKRDGGSI